MKCPDMANLIMLTLFFIAFFLLAHSYLFYPLLLRFMARGRKNNTDVFAEGDTLPFVSVIMSLYNEEKVIARKLETLLHQEYPPERRAVFIGSDGSIDATNTIVARTVEGIKGVTFIPFTERRGKPGVINQLVEMALQAHPPGEDHILLLTDASVMQSPRVTYHLAKHFRNTGIGVVDAFMIHTGLEDHGISRSEDHYISSEVRLKHWESIVWRQMIGPFGGCYAVRSDFFTRVPPNFLVDDFFITMKAFEKGALAINEPEAKCYEPVSHEWREEFRRKARISAGNFQNLLLFRKMWWPPFSSLSFAFFSHKILRWIGPFLLLIMGMSSAIGALKGNLLSLFLFLCFIGATLLAPLLDAILKKLGINLLLLRNIRYFILMNIALMQGFFKFLKGIRSNVWEPTKRN